MKKLWISLSIVILISIASLVSATNCQYYEGSDSRTSGESMLPYGSGDTYMTPDSQTNPNKDSSDINSITQNNGATIFSQLAMQTGFDQQLSSDGPYTIFVPTDNAIQNIPQETLQKVVESQESATSVLKNHVVKGVISQNNIDQPYQNLNGDLITIAQNDQGTFVNGQKITGAQKFDNGAVYFIDGSVLPKNMVE